MLKVATFKLYMFIILLEKSVLYEQVVVVVVCESVDR